MRKDILLRLGPELPSSNPLFLYPIWLVARITSACGNRNTPLAVFRRRIACASRIDAILASYVRPVAFKIRPWCRRRGLHRHPGLLSEELVG